MPDPDPEACSLAMHIAFCQKVPIFADLDVQKLAQVNRHCHAKDFDASASICREGDAATHIYVFAVGIVKTTLLAADGRESLINLPIPGDFFGARLTSSDTPPPRTARRPADVASPPNLAHARYAIAQTLQHRSQPQPTTPSVGTSLRSGQLDGIMMERHLAADPVEDTPLQASGTTDG